MPLVECNTGLEGMLRRDTSYQIPPVLQQQLDHGGMSAMVSPRQKQLGLNIAMTLSGASEGWKDHAPQLLSIDSYVTALNAIRFTDMLYRSAGLFVDHPVAPAELGDSNLLVLSANDHTDEFQRLHPFTAAYGELYAEQIASAPDTIGQVPIMARLACAAYEAAYFNGTVEGPCAVQPAA